MPLIQQEEASDDETPPKCKRFVVVDLLGEMKGHFQAKKLEKWNTDRLTR